MKKRILIACISAVIAILILFLSVNLYVTGTARDNIITAEQAVQNGDYDCILVLGAGLRQDGTPSDMLRDRLLTGIDLLGAGASERLMLSGDNSGEEYNEVGAMAVFCTDSGVDSSNIVLDNSGFSTYESIYNAVNSYGYQKILIVTQEYHLYRALYIADSMGIEADGVAADRNSYRGQLMRDAREVVARFKDFFKAAFC